MFPAIRSCTCSRRYADDAGGRDTGAGAAFGEGELTPFSGPGVRAVGGGLARNIANKSAFGVGVGVGVGWGVEGGVAWGSVVSVVALPAALCLAPAPGAKRAALARPPPPMSAGDFSNPSSAVLFLLASEWARFLMLAIHWPRSNSHLIRTFFL